jgi:hypothetical protein
MRSALVFLAVLFSCVFAAQRPKISEVFEARALIHIKVANETALEGEASWAVDQPAGLGLEIYRYHKSPQDDLTLLQRFDLHSTYMLHGSNRSQCNTYKTEGEMPMVWDWVKEAEYKGRRHHEGKTLDIWEFSKGHAVMELGVTAEKPDIPVILSRKAPTGDFILLFRHFFDRKPEEKIFTVPRQCDTSQSPVTSQSGVGCVSGGTMTSRGQQWVNARVPYNQKGTYGGYREDCSGFVSMCWELSKPGLTTFTLPTVSHPISKSELKPGDILLNKSEHVVLFGGWVDSSRTKYMAYEETRPGEGTVKRATPYPYWYNQAAFLPYRYKSIC